MQLALSIDLDGARFYRRIHDLPGQRSFDGSAGFVLSAVETALDLARELRVTWTFFVVTEDLGDPALVSLLARALTEGHAVESHGRTHPYDLSRRTDAELDHEIAGSFDDLERALGTRPRGFRAPGYTLSAPLLRAVLRAGGTFDASLLPSPPYALAKLAALGLHALRGRRSESLAFAGAQLAGPRAPHAAPLGVEGLIEIPMAVSPRLRLPLIGTFLLRSPLVARALLAGTAADRVLSLEFHALDFVGKDLPDTTALSSLELSLHTARATRVATFREVVAELARARRSVALRDLRP